MPEAIAYLAYSVLIGAGATAVMDIWAVARKRLLGIPALDYGLVGRWLVYLTRGRFRHDPIAASPASPPVAPRVLAPRASMASSRT